MVKRFKAAACAALAMSIALSSTAFADVIYAPGVNARSESGPTGDSTQQESSAAQTQTQTTGTQTAGSQTQTTGTQTAGSQTQTTAQSSSAAGPGVIGPGGTQTQTAATQAVSNLGSAGQGVEQDPVLGETPIIGRGSAPTG